LRPRTERAFDRARRLRCFGGERDGSSRAGSRDDHVAPAQRIVAELRHCDQVTRSTSWQDRPDDRPTISDMTSVVILGGGPGGNTCAAVAATLGADVTLVESDIVGGAAHLWDCIPSK